MAANHDINNALYELERKFHAADFARLTAAREKTEAEDQKHLAQADRITTLLLANKCAPPDHVASWFTYSRDNPNRKELKQAGDSR
jgi:hypothetical protein